MPIAAMIRLGDGVRTIAQGCRVARRAIHLLISIVSRLLVAVYSHCLSRKHAIPHQRNDTVPGLMRYLGSRRIAPHPLAAKSAGIGCLRK